MSASGPADGPAGAEGPERGGPETAAAKTGCLTLLGHQDSVYDACWLPDGRHVVSGSRDGTIVLWKLQAGEAPVGTMTRAWTEPGPVHCVAAFPDGRLVAAGSDAASGGGSVVIFDVSSGEEVLRGEFDQEISAVSLGADGILVAGLGGLVQWWGPAGPPALESWDLGQAVFNARRGPAPGQFVVAADGAVVFLDRHRPGQRRDVTFGPERVRVLDVLAAPDGITFAASLCFVRDGPLGSDYPDMYEILVWDPAAGDAPPLDETLLGHASWVRGLDFSPDGRLLASAGFDESVRLWDPARGLQKAELTGHQGAVYWARFSPDGERILTACADGAVRVCDLGPVIRPAGAGDPGRVRLSAGGGVQWTPGPGRDAFLSRAVLTAELLLGAADATQLAQDIHGLLPMTDVPPNLAVIQVLNIRAEQARREGDDDLVRRCRWVQQEVKDHSDRYALAMMTLMPRGGNRGAEAIPSPDGGDDAEGRAAADDDEGQTAVPRGTAYVEAIRAAVRAGRPAGGTEPGEHPLGYDDHLDALSTLGAMYEDARSGANSLGEVISVLSAYLAALPADAPGEMRIIALDMLGSASCISGDNTAGLRLLEEARDLCARQGGKPALAAGVEQHYGNALRNTGQLLLAVATLQHAVELARAPGGITHVEALINLAVVYGDLGIEGAREQALETAARAAGTAGLTGQLASCRNNLGTMLYRRGDMDGAERHFAAVGELARELGDRRLLALATGNLADVDHDLGRLDDAAMRYRAAYDAAVALEDPGLATHALDGLAGVLAAQGQTPEAERVLRDSLEASHGAHRQRRRHTLRKLAGIVADRDPGEALSTS